MSRTPDAKRRAELLERSVEYVLAHGLADLSLRPLAKAIGSSPRVLLYHFGSKEQLVVDIIRIGRARQRERLVALKLSPELSARAVSLAMWREFTAPHWLPLMRLFFEVYALAMQDPQRFPGFLERAVEDWLDALEPCASLPGYDRDAARAFASLLIAAYRGLMLDLCATGDRNRVERAFDLWNSLLESTDAAA